MRAFLSYQTTDREVAAKVKDALLELGIEAFMAHEDIDVSEEWRLRLLAELGATELFVAILSEAYARSFWCIQEAGIAAFRSDKVAIVPLRIDATQPPAFMSHIQSQRLDPGVVGPEAFYPCLARRDPEFLLDRLITRVASSGGFRSAEAHFREIKPYLPLASDAQIKRLLEASLANGQVSHAGECAREHLPPLLESHGHLLAESDLQKLRERIADYAM